MLRPIEVLSFHIEKWDPAVHDKAGFDCGVQRLNNFLHLSAKKQTKDNMSRVYVLVEDGSKIILGYHAINLGSMNVTALTRPPKGTPSHGEIPVLFIGQVAVSLVAQGRGISSILMHHIFEKAQSISQQAGCYALLLDVMDDGGQEAFARRKNWYAEFGFQSFLAEPSRMFLPVNSFPRFS